MAKYRNKPVTIEAVQVTDSTFDAPHPNSDHIRGVIYDPIKREVRIPVISGHLIARMGDWIITRLEDNVHVHFVINNAIFQKMYEAVDE